MNKAQITVIGHYGLSLIFDVTRFPAGGETLCAIGAGTEKGGKGFNQAFAAAKLGAKVNFITALGDDEVGQSCKESLKSTDFGGGNSFISTIQGKMTACGVAMNSADKDSRVVVYSGAIMDLRKEDIRQQAEQILSADILLVQNEIPPLALEEAIDIASQAGIKIVYNPAPAIQIPNSFFRKVFCITPNETEAAILTGQDVEHPLDLKKAFDYLHQLGAKNIVITLGSAGAAVSTSDGKRCTISPLPVSVVNTTGAGDCFNAAFGVALAEGKSIIDAAIIATVASGLSVSRDGICESIPDRSTLENALRNAEIKITEI